MFQTVPPIWTDKTSGYEAVARDLAALLDGEPDLIANAANTAALLFHQVPDVNWVGFYFLKDGELVLGPFQGKPACVRIPVGKGVCGAAASRRETVVVPDVDRFPGHIACDSASRAELVVPLVHEGELLGVLDLDSPTLNRFDDDDRRGCERLVQTFVTALGQAH